MANRSTEVGRFLRAGDTALARRRVQRALERARGNVTAAARILRVDDNTIWRWIWRLALEDVVEQARELRRAKKSSGASTRVDAGS